MAGIENPEAGGDPRRAITLLDSISKAAAVLGAVIAVGQAGTSWIHGYWQAQLAEVKDRSALAESYIKLITSKETSPPDRLMMLGALSELKGHPLQSWAALRYQESKKNIDNLNAAYDEQTKAHQLQTENQRREAGLVADISALNAEIAIAHDDVEKTKLLSQQRVAKSEELLLVRAKLSVASAQLESSSVMITHAETASSSAPAGLKGGDSISALSNQVNAGLLMSIFPKDSRVNVEQNVRFLAAALQEFRINDPRVVASIIATIFVETPTFGSYVEKQSASNTVKQPFDRYANRLGNVEAGDAANFRGRGFLGLTGRSNYETMSKRLGLGSRLVDNPDDANSPEVSARIVCAFFADRLGIVQSALDAGDFERIRRLVSGGTSGVTQFVSAYRKVLPRLDLVYQAAQYAAPVHGDEDTPELRMQLKGAIRGGRSPE
jgi:peptidoglycan L-alanyl-D-glutamate endopeptidase CwlK